MRKKPLKRSYRRGKGKDDTKHAKGSTPTSMGRTGAFKGLLPSDKTKPKKKPTKTPLQKLSEAADNLARADCHSRGGCQAINFVKVKKWGEGCSPQLHWAHIFSRRHKEIRWCPLNCLCLCASCHRYFTIEPKEFVDLVESLYPGRWDELRARLDNSKSDPQKWIDFYRENNGSK